MANDSETPQTAIAVGQATSVVALPQQWHLTTISSADVVVGLEEGRLVPVKFELRPVPAVEAEEQAKAAKDHCTDGIGLRRDQFET